MPFAIPRFAQATANQGASLDPEKLASCAERWLLSLRLRKITRSTHVFIVVGPNVDRFPHFGVPYYFLLFLSETARIEYIHVVAIAVSRNDLPRYSEWNIGARLIGARALGETYAGKNIGCGNTYPGATRRGYSYCLWIAFYLWLNLFILFEQLGDLTRIFIVVGPKIDRFPHLGVFQEDRHRLDDCYNQSGYAFSVAFTPDVKLEEARQRS